LDIKVKNDEANNQTHNLQQCLIACGLRFISWHSIELFLRWCTASIQVNVKIADQFKKVNYKQKTKQPIQKSIRVDYILYGHILNYGLT
jgi:hypothetical protein